MKMGQAPLGFTPGGAVAWGQADAAAKAVVHNHELLKIGAGEEIRTLDPNLGKVVLYH